MRGSENGRSKELMGGHEKWASHIGVVMIVFIGQMLVALTESYEGEVSCIA